MGLGFRALGFGTPRLLAFVVLSYVAIARILSSLLYSFIQNANQDLGCPLEGASTNCTARYMEVRRDLCAKALAKGLNIFERGVGSQLLCKTLEALLKSFSS